ncbi:MAG: hypothetical protein FD123_1484 [Bacteroidetes bacterium]|nr:MAG: hypothetical protein FD123_1484 [Bacteroidota bacterium]
MNDLLFDIIQSMSKNEKGFFKKNSRVHSASNDKEYLRLFDVIDKMKQFDDKKLKKKTSRFIPPSLLPARKNYLKNILMKSMRQFKDSISHEMELNNRLSNMEILFRNRLIEHCKREIVIAKRLMENAELYNYFHAIAYWERQLLNDGERSTMNEACSLSLAREESDASTKIMNIAAFERLAYRMYSITYASGDLIVKETENCLRELLSDPLLSSEKQARTVTSKIIFNNIYSKYFEVTGDAEQMLHCLDRVIFLFEEHEKYKHAHISKYMNALYNNAKACAWMGKSGRFDRLYRQLEEIPALSETTLSPSFLRSHRLLMMNLRMHRMARDKMYADIICEIDVYHSSELYHVPSGYAMVRMELQYFFAFSLFSAGQNKQALKWLNILLENKNLRQDIVAYARLMLLAIQYELENDILLTYELRSVKRYLEKSQRNGAFENNVLDFIRLLINLNGNKVKVQGKLERIYHETKMMEQQTMTGKIYSEFSLIHWMEKKVKAKKR